MVGVPWGSIKEEMPIQFQINGSSVELVTSKVVTHVHSHIRVLNWKSLDTLICNGDLINRNNASRRG